MRTSHTIIALTTLSFAATATAGTGSITQSFNLSQTADRPNPSFNLDAFDTMGGTRALDNVTFNLSWSINTVMEIQNVSDFAVRAGDWSAELLWVALVQFDNGLGNDGIFAGLGGIGYSGVTADLPAGDGNPFGGMPGIATIDLGEATTASQLVDEGMTARQYFAIDGGGIIDGSFGALFSPEIFSPALLNFVPTTFDGEVELDITYNFTEVPAPGAAGLLGLAGIAATRRRR